MSDGLGKAKIAIFVVSAMKGELEAALKERMPELLLLLKGYPVQLILAVNKMDTVSWNEAALREIVDTVNRAAGAYRLKFDRIVPVSGMSGRGIAEPAMHGYPSLFDALVEAHSRLEPERTESVSLVELRDVLLRVTGDALLTRGWTGILHLGSAVVDCEIVQISGVTFLKKNQKGRATLRLGKPVQVDRSTSSCVLRTPRETVAIGELALRD